MSKLCPDALLAKTLIQIPLSIGTFPITWNPGFAMSLFPKLMHPDASSAKNLISSLTFFLADKAFD